MIATPAASHRPKAKRFAVIRIAMLSIAQFHFALISYSLELICRQIR